MKFINGSTLLSDKLKLIFLSNMSLRFCIVIIVLELLIARISAQSMFKQFFYLRNNLFISDIPCIFPGHIHPGNIAILNQRAQLLDVENILLGGSSLYRPYLLQLRRTTAEAIDVYSFARTLYEMAFATPLEDYCCDDYPDCDMDLGEDSFIQYLRAIARHCLSLSVEQLLDLAVFLLVLLLCTFSFIWAKI